MRADRRAGLHALGEVLALQHLLQCRLRHQAEDVRGAHLRQPLRVVPHLDLRAIEHHLELHEVGLGVARDLFLAQHRPGRGSPARITDQCGVVADDDDDRVPVVLKHSKRVENDEMTDMKIGRRRIKPELDAQLVTALKPLAEMVGDVDLDRPLPQALEQPAAHAAAMGLRDWS